VIDRALRSLLFALAIVLAVEVLYVAFIFVLALGWLG